MRPACAFVKRLAGMSDVGWDEAVPKFVVQCCSEIARRMSNEDPVRGMWYVDPASNNWTVWCDASSLATAAVQTQDGKIIEDGAWLRGKTDKRHINVAELEVALKGIDLAIRWNVKKVKLATDSKTVAGWLRSVLSNIQRVKVGGLHEPLVRLRLQVVADTIAVTGMRVSVEWVSTDVNLADGLTRVSSTWPQHTEEDVSAAMHTCVAATQLSLARIREEQQKDEVISCMIHQILLSEPITNALYRKYLGQLTLRERILCRTWMDPIDGEKCVPVIPTALQAEVTSSTHQNSGHVNWETTWKSLKQRCFFPAMAKQCQSCVQECQSCRVANPARGVAPPPPAMCQDIPSMPWEVVQIDTLELGCQHGGRYHCVLVCVDMFTRWVEVLPLRRHNAVSVAEAFIEICTRFGPPRVIRCDNGSEFRNHIVESLFHVFGVSVSHGAVRHPQSQGGGERFNQTLLTLIRKAVDVGNDWEAELQMLLFFYRTRPHSVPGLSAMTAMFGWNTRDLTIEPMDANDRIELDACLGCGCQRPCGESERLCW